MIPRRLRAVIGNALVWSVGWFVAALAVSGVMYLIDGRPAGSSWAHIFPLAARIGVVGGLAGAVFSGFIALGFRGRRLSDISVVRFAIGGGIVVALFIPVFIIVMRFLSGDPFLPLSALLSNAKFGLLFGGAAAGVSLKLAQLADARLLGGGRHKLENHDHAALGEGTDDDA